MIKFITLAALAASLIVPAAASASAPVSTFYQDGRVTVKEGRSETKDLLRDKDIRASLFRAPTTLTDGTPSSVEDPAVTSTHYRILSCETNGERVVLCAAVVSASTATDDSYRADLFTVRVKASSKVLGSASVENEIFTGATL